MPTVILCLPFSILSVWMSYVKDRILCQIIFDLAEHGNGGGDLALNTGLF